MLLLIVLISGGVTMESFKQQQFNSFMLENRVIGFFQQPITLKSGRRSSWYVNWRTITEDVFLTEQLSSYLLSFISAKGLVPDTIYGVPQGATKLAIISQYKWAKLDELARSADSSEKYCPGSHALSMGRGRPKEHGAAKDRYFLGMPRGNIAVVEDVTTTGGSLISAIEQIEESDGNIMAAISLTDRMELRQDGKSVGQALAERGINYLPMSNAAELLPLACELYDVGDGLRDRIEAEFRRYGTEQISLKR
jgi:orotate phosphoribosyltransferase